MSKVKKIIGKTPSLQHHIVGDYIVDNSIPDDEEMLNVKTKLFEVAEKEKHWGEERPLSWIPLEKNIIDRRDSGTRILTLYQIRKINNENYIKLLSNKEIDAFLRFHNALGNMMFFGGTESDDLVILDPQWLIDSLKQIITHKQFFRIPRGLEKYWEKFTESAILYKKLIDAVWSRNTEDPTFIRHKDKLLEILDSTDIVAYPKVYNAEGKSLGKRYVFVPSMLKPNQEGIDITDETIRKFRRRSPIFYFVFKEKFLPPAVFSRLQAACAKEYRMQIISDKALLFYQIGVFRLSKTHDLILQQYQYTIRVTVGSSKQDELNPHICEAVITFLDDNLRTQLYHRGSDESSLPFYKAIQCTHADKEELSALHPLPDLEWPMRKLCWTLEANSC